MAVLQISISVYLVEFLSLRICSFSGNFNDRLFGEASPTAVPILSKELKTS